MYLFTQYLCIERKEMYKYQDAISTKNSNINTDESLDSFSKAQNNRQASISK